MTTPFQAAGADKTKATRYAPIWTNRFHTGLWTQRNPLRDAATQYLMEKFYSGSRYESLIDGQNVELTTRLTLARRPGTSAYNAHLPGGQTVNRFYGFHLFSSTADIIKVMADSQGVVYEVTDPTVAATVFTKSAGAGSTYFQSVGNTLYMGNGVDQKKWVQSVNSWTAATLFTSNQYIVDSNKNLQVAMGARSASISSTSCASNVITMTFTGKIALLFVVGMSVTFAGLTTSAGLNGVTRTITSVNYNQITFSFVSGNFGTTADTGTASCAGGNTGGSAPTWGTTIGAITADGSQQWLCKGPSVQNWGLAAPVAAPTAVNSTRPAPYPNWAANTVYSPSLSIIGVSGGNSYIQTLTTGGTTGGAEPVWNATLGGTTNDGSAQWTNSGLAAWAANTAYALNRIIAVTWTYYITIETDSGADDPVHGHTTSTQTVPVTTSAFFQATAPGTTGSSQPAWTDGVGSTVADNNVTWTNIGAQATWTSTVGATTLVSTAQTVIDTNGNKETISAPGKSGGTAPTWATASGKSTIDNTATWLNAGSYSGANTGAWLYAYAFKNSVTNTISTASSESLSITQAANKMVTVQGSGAIIQLPTLAGTYTLHDVVQGTTSFLPNGNWYFKIVGVLPNGNEQPFNTEGVFNNTGFSTLHAVQVFLPALPTGVANWRIYYGTASGQENQYIDTVVQTNYITGTAASGFATAGVPKGAVDTQVDTIQIYRTLQGASTLFLLDEIPAPPTGATWTYNDSNTDDVVNEFIEAQIDSSNNPPPVGLIALTYHLSRVWGAAGNTVYYSGGPDTINGNGNETFAPLNTFVFPSKVTRLLPNPLGLLVFTASDIYLISGLGTAGSPLFSLPFIKGIGLKGYDALDVNGSIIYMFTADSQLLSLDPNSGISEIGFPIGDKLSAFNPSSTYVAWHVDGSTDKALYLSDGATGWYRMNPTSAPETGLTWSPFAFLGSVVNYTDLAGVAQKQVNGTSGCSAVQSIEVSPGVRKLLIGPSSYVSSVSILQRDHTVATDGGVAFSAFATFGSIILAHPGQMAELGFITTDVSAVGLRPSVSVLLDEVTGRQTFSNFTFQRTNNVVTATAGLGTYLGQTFIGTSATTGMAPTQSVTITGSSMRPVNSGAFTSLDGTFPLTAVTPTSFQFSSIGPDLALSTNDPAGTGSHSVGGISTIGYLFAPLTNYVNDPPQLGASQTVFGSRYYFNQTQAPAWCRHMQIRFDWTAENAANELLAFTLYGAVYQEK